MSNLACGWQSQTPAYSTRLHKPPCEFCQMFVGMFPHLPVCLFSNISAGNRKNAVQTKKQISY
jgi:hypothetical protein